MADNIEEWFKLRPFFEEDTVKDDYAGEIFHTIIRDKFGNVLAEWVCTVLNLFQLYHLFFES